MAAGKPRTRRTTKPSLWHWSCCAVPTSTRISAQSELGASIEDVCPLQQPFGRHGVRDLNGAIAAALGAVLHVIAGDLVGRNELEYLLGIYYLDLIALIAELKMGSRTGTALKNGSCPLSREPLMSRLFGSALIPVLICILGANVSAAERSSAANPVPQDYADTTGDFLKTITENRNFILRAARLAVQTSRDAMVKELAQNVIRSHTRGYSNVGRSAPAAFDQTVESQGELRPEQGTALDELKRAGDRFDLLFIDSLVATLRDNLDNLQKYAVGGTNAKLKEAAADGVTEETADLAAAEGLQTEIHNRR